MSNALLVSPTPVNATSTGVQLFLHPRRFAFEIQGRESTILSEAFERYTEIIFEHSYPARWDSDLKTERLAHLHGAITAVCVYVLSSDQSLGLQTSETYTLRVAAPTTIIEATTVYGALRALETLAQLMYEVEVDSALAEVLPTEVVEALLDDDADDDDLRLNHSGDKEIYGLSPVDGNTDAADVEAYQKPHRHHRHHRAKKLIVINETAIYDTPRFRHRGLLIDSARHYLPLRIIKAHLDGMVMAKLNVLHWHLSDDQSFPFVSDRLPELSTLGAFSSAVYTKYDIQEIVSYARARGIRIVPEFDTPGHVAAFGLSHPELLTECYDKHEDPSGERGPMDPTWERTYTIMWQLMKDVAKAFPDAFVHLGGDEVDGACWLSNPHVRNWMAKQGMGRNADELQAYHTGRVIRLAAAAGKEAMVWQEAAEGAGLNELSASAIVQVWKWAKDIGRSRNKLVADKDKSNETNNRNRRKLLIAKQIFQGFVDALLSGARQREKTVSPLPQGSSPDAYWQSVLGKVTKTHRAVLSAPWYLNLAAPTETAWETYWKVEPLSFEPGSQEQRDRVVGGTACAWGELVDSTNAIQKTWPLAAVVAERLWSDESVRDIEEARSRLAVQRCRMLRRGVPAAPLGPGFCPEDIDE